MIVSDREEALRRLARGEQVVLIVAGSAEPLGPVDQAPGRLAVIVGDAQDPAVRAAAEEMERELFQASRPPRSRG